MQDPIKSINFSNANPVCHAFDSEAKDGHDLLIGLNTGDGKYLFVYIYTHFCLFEWSLLQHSAAK